MDKLSGQLTARLADRSESYEQELVDEINRRVHPPKPITSADVFIRAMYIVSDQINSQGGKFEEPELDQLVNLMPDAPVMIGHRRDSLPVARNFYAVKTMIDGRVWVKSYFYWMKDGDGAEDFRRNIDGGIYKECSISFLFQFPQCSICGEDIRRCSHIPFREYEATTGETTIAYFVYRQIEKVLETSMVFRGAIPDTHITDKLESDGQASDYADGRPLAVALFTKADWRGLNQTIKPDGYRHAKIVIENDPKRFHAEVNNSAVAYPYQPGIPVRVSKRADEVHFESSFLFPEAIRLHLSYIVQKIAIESIVFDALVYGTRGKDRLNGIGLARLIESAKDVHRLHLRIMDIRQSGDDDCSAQSLRERLRRIDSMSDVFANAGIELIKTHQIDPENPDIDSLLTKFIYGLEVLVESESGRLMRHILGRQRLAPVVVKKIYTKQDRSMVCHVEPVGGTYQNNLLADKGSPTPAVGDVLLAEAVEVLRDRKRLVRLFDILPGTESHDIVPAKSAADADANVLFSRDGRRLLIRFALDGIWRKAIVHHFNRKMFAEGRRFIAELKPVNTTEYDAKSHAIGPARISRCGKLILVRLSIPRDAPETISGFWLRPVLIDGEERYLFYSADVSYSQGEL